jgi:hypothetical protein
MEDSSRKSTRQSIGKGDDADGSSKAVWTPKLCGEFIWKNMTALFSSASWTNGHEDDFKFTMKAFAKAGKPKVDSVTVFKGYSELFECSVYRNEDLTYFYLDKDTEPLHDGGKALNEFATMLTMLTKLDTLSSDEAIKAAIEKRNSEGPIRNGLPTADVIASLRDDAMDVDTAAGTAPSSHPSSILPLTVATTTTGGSESGIPEVKTELAELAKAADTVKAGQAELTQKVDMLVETMNNSNAVTGGMLKEIFETIKTMERTRLEQEAKMLETMKTMERARLEQEAKMLDTMKTIKTMVEQEGERTRSKQEAKNERKRQREVEDERKATRQHNAVAEVTVKTESTEETIKTESENTRSKYRV